MARDEGGMDDLGRLLAARERERKRLRLRGRTAASESQQMPANTQVIRGLGGTTVIRTTFGRGIPRN